MVYHWYIVTLASVVTRRSSTGYPTLSYPTLPYPTLPYHALPYPTLCPTLPYPTLRQSTRWYEIARILSPSSVPTQDLSPTPAPTPPSTSSGAEAAAMLTLSTHYTNYTMYTPITAFCFVRQARGDALKGALDELCEELRRFWALQRDRSQVGQGRQSCRNERISPEL